MQKVALMHRYAERDPPYHHRRRRSSSVSLSVSRENRELDLNNPPESSSVHGEGPRPEAAARHEAEKKKNRLVCFRVSDAKLTLAR